MSTPILTQRYPIETKLLRDGLVDTLIAFAACVGFLFAVVALEALYHSNIKHRSQILDKIARKTKLAVKYVLVEGPPSFFLDIFSLCVTLTFCILYIYEIYDDVPLSASKKVGEVIVASCVIVDYIRHFLSATSRSRFCYSGWWLLTLFTALNVLVPIGQNNYTPYLGFFRFFRIPTLVTKNTVHFHISSFMLELLKFAITVFAALLSAAGMLFLVENTGDPPSFDNQQDLEYFECFYWVVVTISTVGYGDISPKTYMGRSVIMGLIAFALWFVPSELSRLAEITKLKPIKTTYSKKATGHVVVVAQEATSLANFLHEFYHPDHSSNELEVVILTEEKLPELFAVVSAPAYRARVFVVPGDPVNQDDLNTVLLGESEACFLLAPSSRKTSDDVTTQHLLRIISIANYKRSNKHNFSIFAQVTHAKSIPHIPPEVDHVICLESLSQGIVAKSCHAPGFSTLVSNLITSAASDDVSSMNTWWNEYEYGKSLEIYTIYMTKYKGEDFIEVALKIYQQHGVILFGIQLDGDTSDVAGNLLLNPANYKVGLSDIGFILAPDLHTAKQIAKVKTIGKNKGSNTIKLNPSTSVVKQMKQQQKQESVADLTEPTMQKLSELFFDVFNKNGLKMLAETTSFLAQMGCLPPSSTLVTPSEAVANQITVKNDVWKLTSKQTLESCTLDSSTLLFNHIIIAGGFDGLQEIVTQLKTAAQGTKSQELKIVILHPEQPSEDVWNDISDFPNVYYMKGSALDTEDCHRCGIGSAHAVVLLVPSEGQSTTSDGFAILAINQIEKLSKCIILAELVDGNNTKFLKTGAEYPDGPDNWLSRILGSERETVAQNSIHYASGRIVLHSVLDFCLGQCFYNQYTMTIFEQLCGGHVEQIPIPGPFQGATYAELVIFLEKTGLVPLGLYRSPLALNQSDYPYVCTSPPASLKVHPEDRIFVILPTEMQVAPVPATPKVERPISSNELPGRTAWRE